MPRQLGYKRVLLLFDDYYDILGNDGTAPFCEECRTRLEELIPYKVHEGNKR